MPYCLQIKNQIYVHDRKLFTIVNNLKVGKKNRALLRKKTIKNVGLKL